MDIENDWLVVKDYGGYTWLSKSNIQYRSSKKGLHYCMTDDTVYTEGYLGDPGDIKSMRKATDEEVEAFYQKHPQYRNYFD